MSVKLSELFYYGSATMPDDDSVNNIGGAISTGKKVLFKDLGSTQNIQVVSSAAGDTTQIVTVYGRNPAGELINEAKTLTGLTPVAMTVNTSWERLLKATKSATTTGDVAVEGATEFHGGTAQGGGADYITLSASASGVDNFYQFYVVRITSGTGSGQIRFGESYNGTTKRLYVRDWTTQPDATSVYTIRYGMVFDKSPSEVSEIRRPFYNAEANPPGGATKEYHEKFFIKNNNSTTALTNATIAEQSDPSGKITFALESVLDGTDTNGSGNNRLVAPAGYTFDSLTKNVANSKNHTNLKAQGVWMKLTLTGGDAAQNTYWVPREAGSTI